MSTIDPYEALLATVTCPLGHRCESCGVESPDLTVVPVALPRIGVACMTVCRRCNNDDLLAAPPIGVQTAFNLVGQHAAHLGITLDEMADILREAGEEL